MRPSDITPTNPAPQLDERLGEPRTGQELEFCFRLCVSGEQQLLRAAAWARIFDASRGLVVSYTVMDVLIVERDELIGTVLADALDQDGLTATLVPDGRGV